MPSPQEHFYDAMIHIRRLKKDLDRTEAQGCPTPAQAKDLGQIQGEALSNTRGAMGFPLYEEASQRYMAQAIRLGKLIDRCRR